MAITRTQAVSANAASVAISSTASGDLIVVFAYDGSTTTVPTLPGGFTSLLSQVGTQQAAAAGWKSSTGGDTSSGTWTNATNVVCIVYAGSSGVGLNVFNPGSSTAISYSSISGVTIGSTIVGFGGAKSATSGMGSAPTGSSGITGLTLVTSQTTVSGSDGTGTATGVAIGSQTISPTSRWMAFTVEIKVAAVAANPLPELIIQPLTPPRRQ